MKYLPTVLEMTADMRGLTSILTPGRTVPPNFKGELSV